MNAFDKFSLFSGFKLKKGKCEIVNIDALKGYHCYSCGTDCIDLTKKAIQNLSTHFLYNKKLENEKNFIRHVRKIEKVLKLWRMRNLDVEEKITIFKLYIFP